MKHVFVRLARQNESELFVKWSRETPQNLFDARAGLYPTSKVLVAFNSDRLIGFVPYQVPFFLEALAFNPEATDLEKAAAMKEFTQYLVTKCHEEGRGEIYFLCEEASTQAFAERQQYERVPWAIYRIRIPDLEPKRPQDA